MKTLEWIDEDGYWHCTAAVNSGVPGITAPLGADNGSDMSNLELNKGDNFIFGFDVSGSMATKDVPGGGTRSSYLHEKLVQFVGEAEKYDPDGVDVIAFGHNITVHQGVTAANAKELFQKLKPVEAATDTAGLVKKAWEMHKAGKYEQTVLFVATDGAPSDEQALENAIAEITEKMGDEREFNISFLVVGEPNADLSAFLTKLDDNLPGAKHDIVDVKRLDEVDFMTAFAGALND